MRVFLLRSWYMFNTSGQTEVQFEVQLKTVTAVQAVTGTLVLFLPLLQSLVPVHQDLCLLAPSLASLSASSFPGKPA